MKTSISVAGCCLLVLLLGCGPNARHSEPARPSPPAVSSGVASAPASAAPAPSAAPSPAAAPAPLPVLAGVSVERELEAKVSALAIDKPPHLSALGERSAWIHDAKGWREEPLPPAIASAGAAELDVFYGRDYRIRVVGFQRAASRRASIYLRWLPGGFRAAPDELGRLGTSAEGGLLALLGTADPEIVCRFDDQCLVKRLSGWSKASAPPALSCLAIADQVGWAVSGQQLLKLGRDWTSEGPPGMWASADALFVVGKRAFVIETARGILHVYEGGAWRAEPVPISAPRALFAVSADALWLAGDGGLARFDGGVWHQVREVPGPLSAVVGRADQPIWAGGAQGLFRVSLSAGGAAR